MKFIYKQKNGKEIEISSAIFVESTHSTLITCTLTSSEQVEGAEQNNKKIAIGKALNAADAFTSALKDLNFSIVEEYEPKVSDK